MGQVKNLPKPNNSGRPPLPDQPQAGHIPTNAPAARLELRGFFLPLLRWWWALLIIPILSGAVAFYNVQHGTVYYQGRVLLGVGPPVKEIKTDMSELLTLRLTASYIEFTTSDRFLNLVIQQAHSNPDTSSLKQAIVTIALKGTPYFEIQFVDTNPDEVINILGVIRNLLMDESPQVQELRSKAQDQFLTNRKIELQSFITTLNQQLSQLNGIPQPVDDSGATQSKTNGFAMRTELDDYTKELAELNQLTEIGIANQLHVVEEPHLLSTRMGAQPQDGAIAMGSISLILVVLFIYLAEKLDPKVRYSYQVEQLLRRKVLFAIKKHPPKSVPFGLLAADLAITSYIGPASPNFNLLCLYDKETTGVEPALKKFGEALKNMGIICTFEDSRSWKFGITAEPPVEDGVFTSNENEKSLSIKNETFSNDSIKWRVISHKWPTSYQYLSIVVQQSDCVLIFCSLKRSYKQSLISMREFLDMASIEVAGVVII